MVHKGIASDLCDSIRTYYWVLKGCAWSAQLESSRLRLESWAMDRFHDALLHQGLNR